MGALIWWQGDIQPADLPCLHADDRGFLLGHGVFETIRAQAGAPVRLDLHWERLARGAQALGIPLGRAREEIAAAIVSLLEANGLREAALRLSVSAGRGPRGLMPPPEQEISPVWLLTCAPLPALPGPARLVSVDLRRSPSSLAARFKTLAYVDNLASLMQARARGADEALVWCTNGAIAGASAANLVLVTPAGWITPRIEDGALAGTMRARLLEAAGAHHIRLRERKVRNLAGVEAAFLTNALIGVRPVARIDDHQLDDAHPALAQAQALVRATAEPRRGRA